MKSNHNRAVLDKIDGCAYTIIEDSDLISKRTYSKIVGIALLLILWALIFICIGIILWSQ